MADKMTKEQRHRCMARIRSKNTRPEWVVRRFLFSNGFRYRLHAKQLPGSPDIVITSLRTCIFINGCFWHGHIAENGSPCKLFVMPKSNIDFWTNKIERNRERDHQNILSLKALGWHTLEIWECQLRPKVRENTFKGLLRSLNLIFLQNHHATVKYTCNEDEDSMIAAEDDNI